MCIRDRIDLFDVAVHASGLQMTPGLLVAARFGLVLPITFGLSVALSRLPALAWTIGLGPPPGEAQAPRKALALSLIHI